MQSVWTSTPQKAIGTVMTVPWVNSLSMETLSGSNWAVIGQKLHFFSHLQTLFLKFLHVVSFEKMLKLPLLNYLETCTLIKARYISFIMMLFTVDGGPLKSAIQSVYLTTSRRRLTKWENSQCISLELMTIFGSIKEGWYLKQIFAFFDRFLHRSQWISFVKRIASVTFNYTCDNAYFILLCRKGKVDNGVNVCKLIIYLLQSIWISRWWQI